MTTLERRVGSPIAATHERMLAKFRECRTGQRLFTDADFHGERATIINGARSELSGQFIHFVIDMKAAGAATIVTIPLLSADLADLGNHFLGWADGSRAECIPP